jgi:hypothetical protein
MVDGDHSEWQVASVDRSMGREKQAVDGSARPAHLIEQP